MTKLDTAARSAARRADELKTMSLAMMGTVSGVLLAAAAIFLMR